MYAFTKIKYTQEWTMSALNIDSYFGLDSKALLASEQRASVIANNLANVDTPNYKAQDMDFNEYLAASMGESSQQLKMTSSSHIGTNANFSTILKYRQVDHASLDGNTVDKDIESTEFAKNAVNYQASLSFLNNKIKNMMTSIKGA
jgi:flagellar basal-body rod protein FlgB